MQLVGSLLVVLPSNAGPRAVAGCYVLLGWCVFHPFMYKQQTNWEFVLETTTIVGGLLVLLSHEQLIHLFMKIDANSDGTVDWDEFTNFMLLENQAAADMSDKSYSERLQEAGPADPNPKHVHHRDMMDGILHLPALDKLFTHSRDGTVRVWNAATTAHMKTLRVSESWVTNTCHFEQSNRVAVGSMDRSISFYDCSSYELMGTVRRTERRARPSHPPRALSTLTHPPCAR